MRISPDQKVIDYWVETFLPPKDIYYLSAGYQVPLGEGVDRMPLADFLAHPEYSSLPYNNTYEFWRIEKAEIETVLVAEPGWFSGLPMPERARLFQQQVLLNRGLVFGLDVLHGHAYKKIIQHAGVEGKLVLNHLLWQRFDLNAKQQTVERVARYWEDFDAEECPEDAPDWVKAKANQFINKEGLNCFGASLFGASGDEAWLDGWIWQDAFLDGLNALGYSECVLDERQTGDVTVFLDESGRETHACFHLSGALVLNKSGQSKYNALKVRKFAEIKGEWEGFSIRTYSRSAK